MKSFENLEREYAQFKVKAAKASKDLYDALNELSLENQQRFKNDILNVLPVGLINFINSLNKFVAFE